MSAVPLDIQGRFEQRWSARFPCPKQPTRAQEQRPESRPQVAAPAKAKRKARRAKAIVCTGRVSAGPKPGGTGFADAQQPGISRAQIETGRRRDGVFRTRRRIF
jgi:hypothetical protein